MAAPFDEIALEQVATFPRPGTAVPGAFRFTPDSQEVTFLFSEEGSLVRSLYATDVTTGERRILVEAPPDLDVVDPRDRVPGVEQTLGELPVVREEDETLALDVEPPHRVQPAAPGPDQIEHRGPALRVADRRDHPAGLVQQDVAERFGAPDQI